jgi:hypothetical protein
MNYANVCKALTMILDELAKGGDYPTAESNAALALRLNDEEVERLREEYDRR